MKWLESVKRFPAFLKEVQMEVKKTSFPSRNEVINTTSVVVVIVLIFGVYLWVADQIVFSALNKLFELFK